MGQRGYVEFSRHPAEKLYNPTSSRVGITKQRIMSVLDHPFCIDNTDFPILMAVGELTATLSLCVVYKFVGQGVRVITFFPAQKGRYEGKVLSRG